MSAEYRYRDYDGPAPAQNDALTRELVCEALRGSQDLDARDIDVYVADGEVTLIGVAESIHEAELAQQIAERCLGVIAVFNQLRLASVYVDYTSDGVARDGAGEYAPGPDVM